jgi:hypothetical protein
VYIDQSQNQHYFIGNKIGVSLLVAYFLFLFIFFSLGRTKTESLICPFHLLVAQMVPLNLKIWVFNEALFNKPTQALILAGIYFLDCFPKGAGVCW